MENSRQKRRKKNRKKPVSYTHLVKGTEAELEQLKAKDIKASVDLTDKVAGEYSVPVTVKLPEGYEQVENTLATIQLAKTDSTKE